MLVSNRPAPGKKNGQDLPNNKITRIIAGNIDARNSMKWEKKRRIGAKGQAEVVDKKNWGRGRGKGTCKTMWGWGSTRLIEAKGKQTPLRVALYRKR